MIKLGNITKRYNTKAEFTCVLRQINLDIAEGEFITIVGPTEFHTTTRCARRFDSMAAQRPE